MIEESAEIIALNPNPRDEVLKLSPLTSNAGDTKLKELIGILLSKLHSQQTGFLLSKFFPRVKFVNMCEM